MDTKFIYERLSQDAYSWYTTSEIAEILDVDVRKVRKWVKNPYVFEADRGYIETQRGTSYTVNVYRLTPAFITSHSGSTVKSSLPILPSVKAESEDRSVSEDYFVETREVASGVASASLKSGGLRKYYDYLNDIKNRISVVEQPSIPFDNYTKILSLSDLHFPFENRPLIDRVLDAHSDADVLVLNGDILDCYAASAYTQSKLVSIMDEYHAALDFFVAIDGMFSKIVVVRGNHEHRIDRFFSRKIDPHMLALVNFDILARLCEGHILDSTGRHVDTIEWTSEWVYAGTDPDGLGMSWATMVGNALFIHPNTYKSKVMETSLAARTHMSNFLVNRKYDTIVSGHTHKVGKVIEGSRLFIEQGCLCSLMDYQTTGNYIMRPSALGCAVIYQDPSGNTDFNMSGFEYYGTLSPV